MWVVSALRLTLERPIVYFTCKLVHNYVQNVGCEHSKVNVRVPGYLVDGVQRRDPGTRHFANDQRVQGSPSMKSTRHRAQRAELKRSKIILICRCSRCTNRSVSHALGTDL